MEGKVYYFLQDSMECSRNWWRLKGCRWECMRMVVKWQNLSCENNGSALKKIMCVNAHVCGCVCTCLGAQVEIKPKLGCQSEEVLCAYTLPLRQSPSSVWDFATQARFGWELPGNYLSNLPPHPGRPRSIGVPKCTRLLTWVLGNWTQILMFTRITDLLESVLIPSLREALMQGRIHRPRLC